jgi:glutaminyl-tRNA synthetase
VKPVVNLIYTVASSLTGEAVGHRKTLINYIISNKISKQNTLMNAIAYLKKLGSDPLDVANLEDTCGIGVVISTEEIQATVTGIIEKNKKEMLEQRYCFPIPSLLVLTREQLKHADPKEIKEIVDREVKNLLGEETIEDKKKKLSVRKEKKTTPEVNNNNNNQNDKESIKELITFPDPKENKQLHPSILEKHLAFTKGVVICRFPPEPNGYLHIGHAKSMNLNFSYPRKSGGFTLLRFDDTNPEAEKDEYFQSIIDDVKWMGHNPKEVTYSSDHFEKLYEFAVELIKRGKAYVCHETADQMHEGRENRRESPWRNRPIEENLRAFEDMRKGKFEEGTATLRMKMDMQNDNPCLRDLVAYRIKYAPHPHAGDKWCIYPSYDYTHCLIDSIENITHSLCTLEFFVRRPSYFWVLDNLDLYRPVVWEYSRLNITHTVLSKRRLNKLVFGNHVNGWDDPRLPTIRGFRRRGYTAEAINDFCDRVGITRSDNVIRIELMELCLRENLEPTTPRAMCVVEPLKVVLINKPATVDWIDVPNVPKKPEFGFHKVPFSSVVYIERSDFRLEDSKNYKRFAPTKPVGLVHTGGVLLFEKVIQNPTTGTIVEIHARWEAAPKERPAGHIHWVSVTDPHSLPSSVQLNLYEKLFLSENPNEKENWLEDLNPNSLVIVHNAFVDVSVCNATVGDRFQFERVGYFCLDPDSRKSGKQVWNRTVVMKEDKLKDAKN